MLISMVDVQYIKCNNKGKSENEDVIYLKYISG